MAKSDFRGLYVDGDILAGGTWVNPDDQTFVQVIDMESAAGFDGVNVIEKGVGAVNNETVMRGLEMNGLFTLEPPPATDPPRRGRKAWDPTARYSDVPTPQPGQLFWTPKSPEGPRIIATWMVFAESVETFDELAKPDQVDVLRALEGAFAYAGFDGSPDHSVIVIDRGSDERKNPQWKNAIISKNPERIIWRELKKMGVEKPDAD